MRKVSVLLALISASVLGTPAFAVTDDDIVGVWRHPDNGSHIQIYHCGASACAKVVSVTEAGRKDVHNPDPKLRDRPVVGVVIMNGGKKVGALKWEGALYNTLDGGTYNGTLELVSEKQLKLSGCILGGLICQSKMWTKIR